MSEDISNQGKIGLGFKMFNSNVAKFAFAAGGLGIVANKFLHSSSDLKEAVITFAKVFTITNFTRSLEQAGRDFHSVNLELGRQYGLRGKIRQEYMKTLRDEERQTLSYGKVLQENLVTYIALSNELRNFKFLNNKQQKELVHVSTQISAAFMQSEESTAEIVANLSLFQGRSGKEITGFYKTILGASKELGISHREIASSISQSANQLYKFNLRTPALLRDFAKMSAEAHALGLDLGQITQTMDQNRHLGGAMQTSALLSSFGIGVNPLELFSASRKRTSNPLYLYKKVFGEMLKKGFDQNGSVNDMGQDIAESLASTLNMSQDQFIKAATYYYKNNRDLSKLTQADIKKQAELNMGFMDRLDVFTKSFTTKFLDPFSKILLPVAEKILNVLGFIGNLINKIPSEISNGLANVITTVLSIALLAQFKTLFGPFITPILKMFGGLHGLTAFFGGMYTPAATAIEPGVGMAKRGLGAIGDKTKRFFGGVKSWAKSKAPKGSKSAAAQTGEEITTVSKALPKPYTMFAQAAMMLAFAGAIWILSKAFQNFSDGVNFKGVMYGIGVMTAFTVAIIAISSALDASMAIILPATILIGVFAGSIWAISKATQNFSASMKTFGEVQFKKIASGISMVGASLASFSNPFTNIFSGIGFQVAMSELYQFGSFAKLYANPISQLASALETIANSLDRITSVDYQKLNLNTSTLAKNTGSIITKSGNQDRRLLLDNYVRVDIDGKKVGRAIIRTIGE